MSREVRQAAGRKRPRLSAARDLIYLDGKLAKNQMISRQQLADNAGMARTNLYRKEWKAVNQKLGDAIGQEGAGECSTEMVRQGASELRRVMSENEMLRAELANAELKIQALDEALHEHERDYEELQRECTVVKADLALARKQVTSATDTVARLHAALDHGGELVVENWRSAITVPNGPDAN